MSDKTQELLERYRAVMMPTYAPSTVIASGKGLTVRDADGMMYYDFTSGIGVQSVGYGCKKVVEAIQKQASVFTHCSNLYANVPAIRLAERLVELSGLGGKVFFCNSGAEANEAAIKLARRWGAANGGRYEVVTFRQGFHGRTLATVAATAQAWCQEGYDPLPVGFAYADYNDLESVKAAIGDKTVAVMLEAVQGEGGVTPATEEFMRGVRQLCDEKNLLMIVDEVQSGIGRTGTWFAWQGYDVKPDLFTCAKALAGGLPMGALVSNAKLADVFTLSAHASTFGGNPVAAAAALAVLDTIESEGLMAAGVRRPVRRAPRGARQGADAGSRLRGRGEGARRGVQGAGAPDAHRRRARREVPAAADARRGRPRGRRRHDLGRARQRLRRITGG